MKRLALVAGLTGSLLFLGTGDLFAHGGQYRGPGDTVPPTEGPGPGTGGPNTGGPTTGPGGGPVTPGGGRGPTTPGGGPVVPGGGGPPRGPVTGVGGKKNKPSEGFEQWQFWWENNKDPYLQLKASLGGNSVKSGSAGFLAGMGRTAESDSSNRPSASEVNTTIVPAIKAVLGDTDADVVDSAVLALARMVKAESADLVFEDIKTALGNPNATVKQSSVLSLGVLGNTQAIPLLIEILNDTAEGRKLMNEKGTIQDLPRAFAAISLGLIGDKSALPVLFDTATKTKDSEINIKGCAIIALGLFKENKNEIVVKLDELLKDDRMARDIRAQIPVSLGRLGADAAPTLPKLLDTMQNKKTDNVLAQSCIIALGEIAGPQDADVVKALKAVIEDGNDDQSRHFAFISLAYIGAKAAATPDQYPDLLKDLNKFLLDQLVRPKKQTHAPWAGIACGLLGRAYAETSEERITIVSKVLDTFEKTNNPSYKSAFAISLGLLKATPAAKSLYKELLDQNERNLKGYLAVALGMMRYSEASETLRKEVLDDADDKMRLQMATALGLLGDTGVVKTLVDALKQAKSLAVQSSVAKALGLIGDRSAVQPLLTLVADKKAPGLARAFACVAVGILAEKFDEYWNTELSVNANYRTVIPAQYEILDIL